jgi:hypothetical protein
MCLHTRNLLGYHVLRPPSLISYPCTNKPYSKRKPTKIVPLTMDSNNLDFMDELAEITIDTTTTSAPLATDLSTSSVQSFVQRPIDPMYMHQMMYPPNFANAPMGPMPYTSGGPLEAFANGAYPTNFNSTKIELIDDLISPSPLEFKYCPDMNTVLHVGKCADCVRFGMHTLLPGNCINFINTTTTHNDEIMGPLHDKIRKLTEMIAVWIPGHPLLRGIYVLCTHT